jgi:hypothetical protein
LEPRALAGVEDRQGGFDVMLVLGCLRARLEQQDYLRLDRSEQAADTAAKSESLAVLIEIASRRWRCDRSPGADAVVLGDAGGRGFAATRCRGA